MKNKEQLIVVDMQPNFTAAKKILKKTINVLSEYPNPIFLEYTENLNGQLTYYSPTYPSLLIAAINPTIIRKTEDGGAVFLKDYIKPDVGVVIIGVNTHYCVKSTSKGLSSLGIKNRVLFSECDCYNCLLK